MSGEGWWSGETGARGVWMYPCPPPQMTASALEKNRTFVVSQDAKQSFDLSKQILSKKRLRQRACCVFG